MELQNNLLYNKYRPKSLQEIVGHEKIKKELLLRSKQNTIPRVILLSGLTGVGNMVIRDTVANGGPRTKTGPVSLGSVQEDQMQGHWHLVGGASPSTTYYYPGNDRFIPAGTGSLAGYPNAEFIKPDLNNDFGTPRTGAQTRDSSVGVLYIIKYK